MGSCESSFSVNFMSFQLSKKLVSIVGLSHSFPVKHVSLQPQLAFHINQ